MAAMAPEHHRQPDRRRPVRPGHRRPQGGGQRVAPATRIGPGPLAADRDLSTWDLFVVWHVWAMQRISADGRRTTPTWARCSCRGTAGTSSSSRPRCRVLGVGRDDFGLPLLDWAADGSNLTPSRQRTAAQLWSVVGGNGRLGDRQVVDGPFTVDQFDIRMEQGLAAAAGDESRPAAQLRRRCYPAATPDRRRRRPRRRHLRPPRLGHVGELVRQPPRRVGSAGPAMYNRATSGWAAIRRRARRRTIRSSSSTTASSTSSGTTGSRRRPPTPTPRPVSRPRAMRCSAIG